MAVQRALITNYEVEEIIYSFSYDVVYSTTFNMQSIFFEYQEHYKIQGYILHIDRVVKLPDLHA